MRWSTVVVVVMVLAQMAVLEEVVVAQAQEVADQTVSGRLYLNSITDFCSLETTTTTTITMEEEEVVLILVDIMCK